MKQLRDLLRIRDFRYLWIGQVASDFGDNLTFLSLLILVQRLTGSTVDLAGLMIAVTLPTLLLGTFAGVYVDRFDRKKIMIVSDAMRAVLVLGFVFVRSAELIPLIYVLAFTQAAIGTMDGPARMAFLPAVVGEEKLLAANSVSQTSRIIFNVLGTAAAGVLASLSVNLAPAFILDSVTFLVSAVLVSRIRTGGEPSDAVEGKVWSEMVDGLKLMIGSRPLRGVLISLAVAMFGIGAVNVLIVPLIIDDLQVSEAFFGAVELSQVLGMVISGTAVALLAARLRPSTLISVGLIGIGVFVGAIGGVSAVWQMMLVLFLVGIFVGPAQAGASTLSQTLVEDSMRGRVGGALSAVISAATILSMGLAGVAAAAIGVRSVFVLAGLICAVGGFLALWLFRGLSAEEQKGEAVSDSTRKEAVDQLGDD